MPSIAVAAVLFGLVGCSANRSEPPVPGAQPTSLASIRPVALAPGAVWGDGRAVTALSGDDGSLSVVTTTGVYHMAAAGSAITEVGTFGRAINVAAAVLSSDGTTLAVAAASPPDVHIYDLVGGQERTSYQLPLAVAIRSLAIQSATGPINVDTTFGPFASVDAAVAPQPLLDALPTGESVRLPDGTEATPLSGTATVALTRESVTEQRTLELPEGGTVLDARSSPNGAVLAVSVGVGPDELDRKDRILVLDPATLNVRSLIETDGPIDPELWAVTDAAVVLMEGSQLSAWSLDGQQIAAGESTGASVTQLVPVTEGVLAIHTDGALERWAADTWAPTEIVPGGMAQASVEVDPSGSRVTTVDYFGLIQVRNTSDGTTIASDNRFRTGETTSVAVNSDGSMVGAASSTGQVLVLDADLTERWAFNVAAVPDRVDAVAFSDLDGGLATGLAQRRSENAFDDTVTMWDPSSQTSRFSIDGDARDVAGCSFFYSRLRFSPDGATMAITSHDFRVIVLDAATGRELQSLPGSTTVLDLAYSPDGALLIATYDNASVTVWSTVDYSQVASYSGPPGGYTAVAAMPDDETMIASDITGTLSQVNIRTGATVMAFAEAAVRSTALALSADGELVAAPTVDGGVGLWSTASGEQLASATGHMGAVTALAFAPDDRWLASSSDDGTVRTWTVSST